MTNFKYLADDIWAWYLNRYNLSITFAMTPNSTVVRFTKHPARLDVMLPKWEIGDEFTIYDALVIAFMEMQKNNDFMTDFIVAFGEDAFTDLKLTVYEIEGTTL